MEFVGISVGLLYLRMVAAGLPILVYLLGGVLEVRRRFPLVVIRWVSYSNYSVPIPFAMIL